MTQVPTVAWNPVVRTLGAVVCTWDCAACISALALRARLSALRRESLACADQFAEVSGSFMAAGRLNLSAFTANLLNALLQHISLRPIQSSFQASALASGSPFAAHRDGFVVLSSFLLSL